MAAVALLQIDLCLESDSRGAFCAGGGAAGDEGSASCASGNAESRWGAAFRVKHDAGGGGQVAAGAGSGARVLLKRPESSLRSASRPWLRPATFSRA